MYASVDRPVLEGQERQEVEQVLQAAVPLLRRHRATPAGGSRRSERCWCQQPLKVASPPSGWVDRSSQTAVHFNPQQRTLGAVSTEGALSAAHGAVLCVLLPLLRVLHGVGRLGRRALLLQCAPRATERMSLVLQQHREDNGRVNTRIKLLFDTAVRACAGKFTPSPAGATTHDCSVPSLR